MKSAYELAMERLNKTAPVSKVSDKQKKEFAELDSLYASKIAEREISLKSLMAKAVGEGDFEALTSLEKQLASSRKNFQTELEEKKDALRKKAKSK